jgi:uncharacterized protein YqeY
MTLQATIEDGLKQALRAGDELRKTTLRGVIAGIKLVQVDKQAPLTDDDVQGVVRKEIKAQREAIADAQKASRPDLIAQAEATIGVLEAYLPQQLSRDEIEAQARQVIAEVGASGPADMGKVMKTLQPRLKDKADGKLISDVVKALLAPK